MTPNLLVVGFEFADCTNNRCVNKARQIAMVRALDSLVFSKLMLI
jgi:hypothetical protein